MSAPGRVDYDAIAARYDRRYQLHAYAGVKESLVAFLASDAVSSAVEVGCGTGHWVAALRGAVRLLVGVEPSAEMLNRARLAATGSPLIRARAESLPFADASVDRVFCVNALHHFSDRGAFFREARRILKPGGALMSIGKDPHAERDAWWVYDYFPETVEADRQRFARVRTLRGEIATAGFDWTESFEADRIEATIGAGEALATGVVDLAFTSQLSILSTREFESGVARIREADAASGGALQLETDFRLYATAGWISPA